MSIRIFMSFQHDDREMARQFKRGLEVFGFSVFLAHDDIPPSADWPETIHYELMGMDVFLPLLTPNFKSSYWTNQETGFAIARDTLIIPLKVVEVNPYGLFYEVQALPVDPDDLRGACLGVMEVIADCDHLREKFRKSLIQGFGNSVSWEDAISKSEYLLSQSPYSEPEINTILRMASQNDNIYGSFRARPTIRELIRSHEDKISPELVAQFNEKVDLWDRMRGA